MEDAPPALAAAGKLAAKAVPKLKSAAALALAAALKAKAKDPPPQIPLSKFARGPPCCKFCPAGCGDPDKGGSGQGSQSGSGSQSRFRMNNFGSMEPSLVEIQEDQPSSVRLQP